MPLKEIKIVNYSIDFLYHDIKDMSGEDTKKFIEAIYLLRNSPHTDTGNSIITSNDYEFTYEQVYQYYPEFVKDSDLDNIGELISPEFDKRIKSEFNQRYYSSHKKETWAWLVFTSRLWIAKANGNKRIIEEIQYNILNNLRSAYTPSLFAKWLQVTIEDMFKHHSISNKKLPKIKGIQ